MDDNQIAVLSASLGGFDSPVEDVKQTISYDRFHFTDKDFPPRDKVMTPRLQAKIPKMFGFEMKPDYEYYLWLDGNIALNNPDTLKYFYDQIQGHDMVVVKHHRRNTMVWESRYLMRGLREKSIYLVNRYNNELWQEQYDAIKKDKSYKDDAMYIGGIFMYRNIPKVQEALKEWWFQVSRYCVQDQISFPYVLRNLKVKVLVHDHTEWDYIKKNNHKKRDA